LLQADHSFSIIFAPKHSRPRTLDLVSEDPVVCQTWFRTLNRILNATKSIEMQKDYELYLHDQGRNSPIFEKHS
jgi:hypothetical protein